MGAFSAIPGVNAVQVIKAKLASGKVTASQFRPPQWSKPALTMITIPPAYVNVPPSTNLTGAVATPVPGQSGENGNGLFTLSQTVNGSSASQAPKFLVFDAVMAANHSQQARGTRIPIQTGANLTNHIMLEPASLVLDVLMTDVLPAYADGQWVGNNSKSIACFQTLDNLRASRVPLTVTTRLKTYTNMYIANIVSDDTVKTLHGFRGRVSFEQMFVASVATLAYSTRPQTTDSTALGTTQTVPPSAGVVAQNGLPSATTGAASSNQLQEQTGTIIGAGGWSSNSTSTLGQPGGGA